MNTKKNRSTLSIIVAMNDRRVIGNNDELLWHLPSDLRRFRKITEGSVIIMGRKTYESIGRPQPNRANIVLSREKGLTIPGCIIASSFEKATEIAQQEEKSIFVIGGEEIYQVALPYVEYIYLTMVHDGGIEGDTTFPNLDPKEWKVVYRKKGMQQPNDEHPFTFIEYQKKE